MKCDIEMHKKNIQGIEVDECEKCEGMWFDNDELRQIKDHVDSDLNWMDFDIWKHPEKFKAKTQRFDCPNCSNAMNVLDYDETKVEIDYCSKCKGIWLEKDELQKIIASLEEELLTKSMSDYVKETLEEATELLTGPESFLSEWKDFTTILRFLQYRILSLKPQIHETLVHFQENPLNR
jgi:Zn-finger nucleic acid-binding protein